MTKPFEVKDGPLAGMKVTSAPQDRAVRLEPYVQRVLDAVGHPDAYVTDMSSISDFSEKFGAGPDNKDNAAWVGGISERLGIRVEYNDLIVDVAERLQGGQ